MTARGGISPSGRAVRWVFWRAPLGAARYTVAGFMATAQEMGRRWTIWAVFGLWLWGLRWMAEHVVRTRWTLAISALLLLLWILRGLSLLKYTIDLRVAAARERAARRQMMAALDQVRQVPGQLRSMASQIPVPGGVFTMRGSMRHHDPDAAEHERIAREQAAEARSWLPPEQADMPLGDKFEPLISWPGFLRRRRDKRGSP